MSLEIIISTIYRINVCALTIKLVLFLEQQLIMENVIKIMKVLISKTLGLS